MTYSAKQIDQMHRESQNAIARKEYHVAESLLKQIICIYRTDHTYHWVLGSVYGKNKKHRCAIASFKRAIRLQKDCATAWAGLARAYLELKQWSKAADAYAKVTAWLNLPFHNVLYASVLNELGEYTRAKECCEKALEVEPQNDEAYFYLGVSLRNLGELGNAASALRLSIGLSPTHYGSHQLLGKILYEDGRLEEAEACFRKASSLCDIDVETHYYLGKIALDRFDLKLACAEFEYAIEIAKSDDSDVLVWAAEDICHYSHDLAEKLYKRAIELDATYERGIAAYAEWLTYCGRIEEANRLLE
jgi:tetratricopeptide (TPR) repeat protein